ncbi:ATP-binding protein [Hydrogenophaga sp.]|uniref:ATP-binding protein n=1 Tax=Hydrogenophaga sp. TaxID=1904254 RepID=UPI00286E0812|nr:ATP-binding protein [Hydrogenophaga sp.]
MATGPSGTRTRGMLNWRDFSIVHKLGLLLAFNTLTAVLLIAIVFGVSNAVARYRWTQEQLHVLAQVVGDSSRAALAFGDRESARQTLGALRANEAIDQVRLLDAQGALFAEAGMSGRHSHGGSPSERLVHAVFPADLRVVHAVLEDGREIGRVELRAHLLHLWLDLLESQALMALLALLLASLAVTFGFRLRRIVTDPILGLAEVSTRVSREQDYSLRAVKAHNDEVGALVDDFNHMLAEIQIRDHELRIERQSLQQRTADMQFARDEAERASRVKSEFIATVSHELRTPLTAISGALGLVSAGVAGVLPPRVAEMVGIALKNSRRLSFLINDLLDMEKLLAGKMHFDRHVQPLMPQLEQSLADNQTYAAQFGVRLVFGQRAEALQVEVDALRLQQVMANLLSNAAKFSPAGSTVEVNVLPSGGTVRVVVADHGPGIPLAFQPHIFQKFSQADASDTRQKGGTGLGLAISRELIEHMGGRMGFESTPGQGARFFFELPVWTAPISQPAALPLPRPAGRRRRRRPHILMVEPDADAAQLLRRIIERAGYRVDAAHTAALALELSRQKRYAAITLDLMLPDVGGTEFIARLRGQEATAHTPLLIVSARIEEGRQSLDSAWPDLHWLAKPVDQSRLLAVLDQVATEHRAPHARVLHVEDDVQLHEVVRAMAGERFDFELATTLREARTRVALERFDVVILDPGLPSESGWDLLPDLQARQPDTRVVVLTGGDISEAQALQVDAVIHKGHVTPDELLDAIGGPDFSETEPSPL